MSALISLVCVILCVRMFLASGNGLWAIWAVLGIGAKVAFVAEAVEAHVSDEFLDRFYGKGGHHE